jgi:hypothetical protein
LFFGFWTHCIIILHTWYIAPLAVGMGMGDYSPGSVWYYGPNKAAPIVFIILFFISGALHAWQTM